MNKSYLLGEILAVAANFCRDYEKGVVQPFIIGYAGSDCKSFSVDRYSGQYGEGYRVHFPSLTSRNFHTVCYFIRGLGYRVHTVLCPINSHDYGARVSSADNLGKMLGVDIKYIRDGSECCYKYGVGQVPYLGRFTIALSDKMVADPDYILLGPKKLFGSRYDVIKRAMCVLNKGEKSDEC